MANVQDLQAKVQKAEEKVEKCVGTITRHKKALSNKILKVSKEIGLDLTGKTKEEIEELREPYRGTDNSWSIYEVVSKLDDIKGAEKKLRDAHIVLMNWNEKLNAEIEKEKFINESAPKVIIEFLEKWKEMAYDWYIKKHEAYQDFKKKIREEEEQAKIDLGITQYRRPTREQEKSLIELGLDYKSIEARKHQFAGTIVMEMDRIRKGEREKWLDKTLEADKKMKLLDLVNRITHITGVIIDASNLRISAVGNLNGYVVGERGKAKVETIGAGGYNIQCFHYRTLVNKMK